MDPNACWDDLNQAAAMGEYEDAIDRARALRSWLENGGFWPTQAGRDEVRRVLVALTGSCPA